MTAPTRWVGVDIETTGLDPLSHAILEVALIKIEDWQVVDLASWVVKSTEADWLGVSEVVMQMHTRNGLRLESLAADLTMPAVTAAAETWLGDWRGLPLFGSSVHFDRGFLAAEGWGSWFSHQHVDATSLTKVAALLGYAPPSGTLGHRALPDILGSLERARACAYLGATAAESCANLMALATSLGDRLPWEPEPKPGPKGWTLPKGKML